MEHIGIDGKVRQGYYCGRCGDVCNQMMTGHGEGKCEYKPHVTKQLAMLNAKQTPTTKNEQKSVYKPVSLETAVKAEIERGGDWLKTARQWMQSNVRNGDSLEWSSCETIHLPFYQLQELAKAVAIAAVIEDRKND